MHWILAAFTLCYAATPFDDKAQCERIEMWGDTSQVMLHASKARCEYGAHVRGQIVHYHLEPEATQKEVEVTAHCIAVRSFESYMAERSEEERDEAHTKEEESDDGAGDGQHESGKSLKAQ